MELRHLRYFVTLAEEENFHRAAERLRISQSPLSRQMRALQDEIGVQLLEPVGRGVQLTDAGRHFAVRARKILEGASSAVEEARNVAQGQLGVLTIGFEPGTAYFGSLASMITAFREELPRIEVRLVPMSSTEQAAALADKTIDVGHGFYAAEDESVVRHLEIGRNRLGVAMSPEHRFASRRSLKTKDLTHEPFVMQPRRLYPRFHDDLIAATAKRGVRLNIVSEVFDLEAVLTLVTTSPCALTFLSEREATVLPLGVGLWKPLTDLGLTTRQVLMWRAAETRRPVLREFLRLAGTVHKRRV